MNRSVLIVICDFLLLMLISSARLDELPSLDRVVTQESGLKIEDYSQQRAAPAPSQTDQPAVSPRTADLLDAMKTSLDEERVSRERLDAMLNQTREALRSQQQLAAEREQQLTSLSQNLRSKEEQARQLEQAQRALAQQFSEAQTNLSRFQQQLASTAEQARQSQQRLSEVQTQYQSAQANLAQMEKQLSSTSEEARIARERLAAIDADLKRRQAEAEAARERIEEVERLRLAAEVERERIAGELKVAETQKVMTQQQLEEAKTQIQTVQQEKKELTAVATELAQGVVTFAEKQGQFAEKQEQLVEKTSELTQEIRENRPLTANTIYADFVTNRIDADFRANRPGILGRTVSKDSGARTILVTDGTQTFAIFHISDTPFKFEEFSKEWERFIVHLYRGVQIVPVPQVSFLSVDPRLVTAPLSEAHARQLGTKVYKTVTDPFKFQDALVIGADEGYYGECRFTIEAGNPNFLKMDRSRLGKLVGKFNPRRGDLVFAKSGEIIGMMVNDKYCAMLSSFVPQATVPTGSSLNGDVIAARLSQMQAHIAQLPSDLQ